MFYQPYPKWLSRILLAIAYGIAITALWVLHT